MVFTFENKIMRNLLTCLSEYIDKQQVIKLHLHIICINYQLFFFADDFWEFTNLNTVYEEIFKLHIFIELR